MGIYNVIQPCIVDGLHYVRPTKQPIEVKDDMAAPLVEAGYLKPSHAEHVHTAFADAGRAAGEAFADGMPSAEDAAEDDAPAPDSADEPAPQPRSRRRSSED